MTKKDAGGERQCEGCGCLLIGGEKIYFVPGTHRMWHRDCLPDLDLSSLGLRPSSGSKASDVSEGAP